MEYIQFDNENLSSLFEERKKLSKQNNTVENQNKTNEINDIIDKMLFIPEYVSIVIDNVKDYDEIINGNLIINNFEYVRLMCSAGQARVNTVIFIREDFAYEVKKRLQTGKNDIKLMESKYNAYFALSSSSTYVIPKPRVLVIDDCEINMVKKVDWISKVEKAEKFHNKEKIEEVEKELTFNLFDGCGAISPDYAQKVADELDIDYLPAGYCIRCSYIKGMVFVVDFQQYAREHNISRIKDIYGNYHNIKDIDMVLTKSQFKLYNAYDSIDDYHKKCDENGILWGVTRVTPKQDDDYFRSNYQFCQVLNLSDDDIKDLCQPTIEWLSKVSGGDAIYALLYLLFGLCDRQNIETTKIFHLINDNIAKSLILNPLMIQDEYIRRTILHSINKKIRESYVGKLILDGNFSVMIPDMVAFMQWMCCEELTGALKEFEHYSQYWNKRGRKDVVGMRSPLTWRSEVNKLNLVNNDLTERWFEYLASGIVYNVWGCDCMIHADADFDGDLVATTDNPTFLSCYYGGVPITYEKQTVAKKKINESKLYKADIRAFNSIIGKITNDSTTNYEILAKYENIHECQKYTNELLTRLKLTRKFQGDAIDKAKGIKVGKMPSHWFRKIKINTKDAESEYTDFVNEIVSDRKPYFFRYLYYREYVKYRSFIKNKDKYCLTVFGKNLNDLLNSTDLTDDEKKFINEDYYKYIPLIDNDGVMNRICHYMENELNNNTIDNSYRTPTEVIRLMQSEKKELDEDKVSQMRELYKKYITVRKKFKTNKRACVKSNLDDNEDTISSIDQYCQYLRTQANNISSSSIELADLAVELCYILQPNSGKDFAWKIFGDDIVSNIYSHKSKECFIPIKNIDGDIKYLGNTYKLTEVII